MRIADRTALESGARIQTDQAYDGGPAALRHALTPPVLQAGPPPSPVIDTYDGAQFSAAGSALAGATVSLRDGSNVIGTATANGAGRWFIDFAALPVAGHQLTAVASTSGGTSAASQAFSVTVLSGPRQVVNGASAADRITGTDGADTLDGMGGSDTLIGGAGNDLYTVGSATDVIIDSSGYDQVYSRAAAYTLADGLETLGGDDSDQTLVGNALQNRIDGGYGADSLDGGDGDDTLSAGSDDEDTDTLAGGKGDDTLYGSGGADLLKGGEGSDRYYVTGQNVVAEAAGEGQDIVTTDLDSYALTANVEILYGSSYDDQSLTGNDVDNVIMASFSSLDDTLSGLGGADNLDGEDGNDVLLGGAGSDRLLGLSGDDTLTGGAGDDTITGGSNGGEDGPGQPGASQPDNDIAVYSGARANYLITAANGAFTVVDQRAGSPDGTDTVSEVERFRFSDGDVTALDILADGKPPAVPTIRGFSVDADNFPDPDGPQISGGATAGVTVTLYDGSSVIASTAAGQTGFWSFVLADLANGAHVFTVTASDASADPASAHSQALKVTVSAAGDTIVGTSIGDNLEGADGKDSLTGGAGDDSLVGRAGSDFLSGGNGADTLDGAGSGDAGADTLAGGAGNDLYRVYTTGQTLIEAKDAGLDTVETNLKSYSLTANVENLTGVGFGQTLTGNTLDNFISGGEGADSLIGGVGDDILRGDDTLGGARGADTLRGGVGNDTYIVNAGDTIIEADGEGTDEVATNLAAYTLSGSLENLRASDPTGTYSHALTGNAGANLIQGARGNDTLDGAGGADTLVGGEGTDVASYASAGAAVTVSLAQGVASGGSGADVLRQIESVIGSSLGDVLSGSVGANTLTGANGDDRLDGGLGNDRLDGSAGFDTAAYGIVGKGVKVDLSLAGAQNTGGAGIDLLVGIEGLSGTNKKDVLTGDGADNALAGGSGADRLAGGGGADSLDGGADADVLSGGAGADRLTGGSGMDRFVYASSVESTGAGADIITDLSNQDIIDLGAIDANLSRAGDQAFKFVAAFHGKAGEAVLSYDAGSGVTSLAGDVDGDGVADLLVQMAGDHRDFANFIS